eukprot:m.76081 g.76081  ORF g.76081 m.76081 type:complete len:114 (+) comp11866_c0_seq6:491-832(+)
MSLLLKRGIDGHSATTRRLIPCCFAYSTISVFQASSCFSRVSSCGWIVKKGGKRYCQGHSKDIMQLMCSESVSDKIRQKVVVQTREMEVVSLLLSASKKVTMKIIERNRCTSV